jgi:DNA repair protein SbcD/Mre11
MVKILHFADAHIDMAAGQGRHDPVSGLPLRVLDFLTSLDTIISTAIDEKVELVIFAGDAYKDRNPSPTYQREWGRRLMRLSQAGIPALLVVGNHDLSPATGRANTLHEFDTLQVPFIRVVARPEFLRPTDLWNLPLQVIGLPWVTRSAFLAGREEGAGEAGKVNTEIESILEDLVKGWIEGADPTLPLLLTAHASVQNAQFGNERNVMLGSDLILPGGLVMDPRLDYVALGHIHHGQDVNEGRHPPVIYPGSIEKVDFGEARETKYFVTAEVGKGHSPYQFRELSGRKFFDCALRFGSEETMPSAANFRERIQSSLPTPKEMEDAVVRLVLEYPRAWEGLVDEPGIRKYAEGALEFHLIRRPQVEARIRLREGSTLASLSPKELLVEYLKMVNTPAEDLADLTPLIDEVIRRSQGETGG